MNISRALLPLVLALVLTTPFAAASQEQDEKPARPPQSEVAAKDKVFAKVGANSPEVKKATPTSDMTAAKGLVGKTGTFVGTVERVFTPRGNGLALLNFAQDYRKAVVGQIRAADFAKFPDLKKLEKKKVMITGKVTEYKDRPQVELTSLSSIKIVE